MDITLTTVCRHVKNYFVRNVESGTFVIMDGIISPAVGSYYVGQYIRIVGSTFNDGILQIERVGDGYIDVSIHDEDYPAWVQPTGGHDAFQIGDRVIHNDVRYVSLINANVTVPGADPRYWAVVGDVEHATRNETFTGAVCGLAIPPDFLELVDDIGKFINKDRADTSDKSLLSESFGGYTYTRATGYGNGVTVGWKEIYASRLNPYRKMWDKVTL